MKPVAILSLTLLMSCTAVPAGYPAADANVGRIAVANLQMRHVVGDVRGTQVNLSLTIDSLPRQSAWPRRRLRKNKTRHW